jgi:translation initiation factor IF-2
MAEKRSSVKEKPKKVEKKTSSPTRKTKEPKVETKTKVQEKTKAQQPAAASVKKVEKKEQPVKKTGTKVSAVPADEKKPIKVEVVKKEEVLKRKAEEEAREAERRLIDEEWAKRQQEQADKLKQTSSQISAPEEPIATFQELPQPQHISAAALEQLQIPKNLDAAPKEPSLIPKESSVPPVKSSIPALVSQEQPVSSLPVSLPPKEQPTQKEQTASKKEPVRKEKSEEKALPGKAKKLILESKSDVPAPAAASVSEYPSRVQITFPLTIGELAQKLNRSTNELIKHLMLKGKMITINQHLDEEFAKQLSLDFGCEIEVVDPLELEKTKEEKVEDPTLLKPRAPVVTVMGHVDHGKTSLLDAIRKTNVTASEEGGITQKIGAYQIELNERKITFLDTPGHEAFTAMRARGTKITDVAILVVAADDGVMPQTLEAIDHAKAANVPIVTAVNKIDKPGANVDRVKQQLSDYGLTPEEWGGNTVFVPISAKQKTGIEELLEMILLVADLADLKANPEKLAKGTIIEAKLDKGKGPVGTVLIQEGTLKVGDAVVAGKVYGKIRALLNDRGERIQTALPSCPVEMIGLNNVPEPGDTLQVLSDEKIARQIAEARALHMREETLASLKRVTLDDLYEQIKQGEIKDLNLIIKADGQGSVEALKDALERLNTNEVRVRVIHTGVGTITESDVLLAAASNAVVIGFNIRPELHIKQIAEREKVDVRLYRIIYQVIEDITRAMVGMLKSSYQEAVIGRAEILKTFKIGKIGTIAGCRVTEGKISREAQVRLLRDGTVVYEGNLASLKRFKDDAREVQSGYECGIGIEKFNDLKERDVIEAFIMQEIRPTELKSRVEAVKN